MRQAAAERVNIGYALARLGEYAEATRELLSALQSGRALGLTGIIGSATLNLARIDLALGRGVEAREVADKSAALFEGRQNRRLYAASLAVRALAEEASGDLAVARATADHALDVCGKLPGIRPFVLAVVARVALRSGDAALARACSQAAIEFLSGGRTVEDGEALIIRTRAEVLHSAGERDGARQLIDEGVGRLSARASRIASADLRASYWAVPDHASLLTLQGELAAGGPLTTGTRA